MNTVLLVSLTVALVAWFVWSVKDDRNWPNGW